MDNNKLVTNRRTEAVSGFISRACDLAYVEEAQGTSKYLSCLHDFLRYLQQESEWVPLTDELKAVNDYITLCRLQDSARRVSTPKADSCFIRHMMLVDTVMQICCPEAHAELPGAELDIRVEIVDAGDGRRRLVLTVDKAQPSGGEQLKRQWDL